MQFLNWDNWTLPLLSGVKKGVVVYSRNCKALFISATPSLNSSKDAIVLLWWKGGTLRCRLSSWKNEPFRTDAILRGCSANASKKLKQTEYRDDGHARDPYRNQSHDCLYLVASNCATWRSSSSCKARFEICCIRRESWTIAFNYYEPIQLVVEPFVRLMLHHIFTTLLTAGLGRHRAVMAV